MPGVYQPDITAAQRQDQSGDRVSRGRSDQRVEVVVSPHVGMQGPAGAFQGLERWL